MSRKILITGGSGFIGVNSALYFSKKGDEVIIFDNFSRKGTRHNLGLLKKAVKNSLKVIEGDIRFDEKKLNKSVEDADIVLHLAAQVAVTTSVKNPKEDFEINALGTLNVLEAVRKSGKDPIFIYSSTNKVYGELKDLDITEGRRRYFFKGLTSGIPETRNLDFHSPYGCSKGVADQYVHDYSRIYKLKTIVFRQSCIYGPYQFGVEDQGWVAWFMIAALLNKSIAIYGSGKQVRDLLYIDDLLRAYELAIKNINKTKGQIYNIGGGPKNTISIWFELKPILEMLFGRNIPVTFRDWRPGDQPIFISDIKKAKKDFGWEPKIGVREGMKELHSWISNNRRLFTSVWKS